MKFITPLILLMSLISLQSCENNKIRPTGGTSTGNPTLSESSDVGLVASALCGSLQKCHPDLDSKSCFESLSEVSNLGGEFYESPLSLKDLHGKKTKGDVLTNDSNLNDCLDSIDQLSCQNDEMNTAWDFENPQDFDSVYKLRKHWSPQCKSSFGPSQSDI